MGGQGQEEVWQQSSPNSAPPLYTMPKDDHWTHFDNSVNAVSFGFVATAVLISMFLVMAIFEKLLRTASPEGGRRLRSDAEAGEQVAGALGAAKLGYTSPKMPAVKAREVSVLMPGNNVPTFIANPAPMPCPPKFKPWPLHEQLSNVKGSSSSSNSMRTQQT